MNRRQCICIFLMGIVAFALAIVLYYCGDSSYGDTEKIKDTQLAQDLPQEETQTLQESMQQLNAQAYFVKLVEEDIHVYQGTIQQFVFCIHISETDMTPEIRQKLEKGIFFQDEEELLDYMESITS